jgi:hypothetical protein
MLRTVAILVGAASWCRIGVPSARLPAGLQSSAQTVDPRLPCPLTHTQMPDGPMTANMHLWLPGFLFRPSVAGKSPDITGAKS